MNDKIKTIDIHTHGVRGYDTETCSENDILRIAEIQGSSGVSEIVLALYTSKTEEMRRMMAVIKNAIEMLTLSSKRHISLSGTSLSKIIGVHLEGPFLNKNKCGSLNPDDFLEPTEYNYKKLIEGFEDIIKIITLSPELKGAHEVIRKASSMGIVVSMGHSEATYYEAEAGFNAGAKGVTHIFNGMRGIHHREPGIAGFALVNNYIYTEVIADPHHLHPTILEMLFRVKNPERIIIISDSVKETGLKSFQEPITDSRGLLKGGSMTITESAKRLIEMGIDKELILKCITENPHRYLS